MATMLIDTNLQFSDEFKKDFFEFLKNRIEMLSGKEMYFDFNEKVSPDAVSRGTVYEKDGLVYRVRVRVKPSECGERVCCFYVEVLQILAEKTP